MYKNESKVIIGKNVKQIEGYKAFIPERFPPQNLSFQGEKLIQLLSKCIKGVKSLLLTVIFFDNLS